jgi:phosphonate transport system substrate-binding protein
VLRGNFDAGVVKESVAAEYASEGLRAVTRSAAIPGPPLVVHRDTPAAARAEIRDLLLVLDPGHPRDRSLMESWTPEFRYGFLAVERSMYAETVWQGEDAP